MLRRLCFLALFAVLLFVAWRLAGVLMDMVMLVVILAVLAACRYWPFKSKS
ncbi:TPA: hypothetical protein ACXG81_004820 [Klebsiella pneumoniae]|uniref:hypothetical protein n=1 Tax=Klebsiella pneumoniae TaxID=573 RepID=UPI0015F2B41E|nr:hypothetical protein [Klebsiella pneumoniae]HDT5504654.1 hypothetical protein [Klebsiella pneumoniae subsp. pneumoniae]HDT4442970.1 hypothetical protein [Klebsiella pneumoniae]HDU3585305.1 hypothetical protein [Klebsiella pneumoniae]HDU5685310.1 hypothetical protein [Klebsiella pneumoniae]HDU5767525.1 hypothetical protein [Klebsiella pneumoniae subsp. pneumoniae]